MNTNNFTNELLTALENAHVVKAPGALFKKMEQVALSTIQKNKRFSKAMVIGIAASFLVLLTANVVLIGMSNARSEISAEQMASSYQLIPTKALYHE